MAAILNSIVSNSYYGMLRGQISMYLPPEHPIIVIWNNRIQNSRRIGKKVYLTSKARWDPVVSMVLGLLMLDCTVKFFYMIKFDKHDKTQV